MSKIVAPNRVPCGFTCIVDTREQLPYSFDSLWDGPAGRSNLIDVPTVRECLPVGDYSVLGHGGIIIERKSKADLYGSVSQARENFEGRLRRMHGEYDCPWVLVEAEWQELLTAPPEHSKFNPKSLSRTILAWMIRYDRVHWLMAPSRAHAEAFAFRLMDRYVKENRDVDRACAAKPIRPGELAGVAGLNDAVHARAAAEAAAMAATPGDATAPAGGANAASKSRAKAPTKGPAAVQGELITGTE